MNENMYPQYFVNEQNTIIYRFDLPFEVLQLVVRHEQGKFIDISILAFNDDRNLKKIVETDVNFKKCTKGDFNSLLSKFSEKSKSLVHTYTMK